MIILKKAFLNYALSIIQKEYDFDDVKVAELRYGLEGFYLTITKAIVILFIAYLFGILKETLLLLLFFNILRSTGFGLHASKSWICLASSIIFFILLPIVSKIIIIPLFLKLILGMLAIVLAYLYAPADTHKHPLIYKKKRNIYKIVTTLNCAILVIISLITKNEAISNLLVFGIYSEIIVILPVTYKLFNLSYANYKNYKFANNYD